MTADSEHYQDKADEAHAQADKAATPSMRRTLLTIAEQYHRLADMAERREQWMERMSQ